MAKSTTLNNEPEISSVEENSTEIMESAKIAKSAIWAPQKKTITTEGRSENIVHELTSRWNLVATTQWSTSHPRQHELMNYDVPAGLERDDTQHILFKPYLLFRSDIEFRLQVNASKFYCGQLLMSWTYFPSTLGWNQSCIRNIMIRTQQPHVTLQIGKEVSVDMVIPFNSFKNYVRTNRENYAVLTVAILSPLKSSDNAPTSVGVSLMYRFTSWRAHGLRIQAQMFSALLKSAGDFFYHLNEDVNRDKPTNVSKTAIIPQGSSSFCTGTNDVDNCNVLRLDLKGQTPLVDGAHKDFTSESITRTYALIDIWKWTVGRELNYSKAINPVSRDMIYNISPINTKEKKLATYVISPLSVYASHFCFWRGKLEFRFCIIATTFHTGRLVCGFIPGSKVINPAKARKMVYQSYYKQVDLTDVATFEFEVPFICETTWARTYDKTLGAKVEAVPTGYIYLMDTLGLSTSEGLPTEVDVLVYVRAGEQFECVVPIESVFAPAFNSRYLETADDELALSSGKWFCGNWRYVEGNKKYVIRSSNVSDAVVTVQNGRENCYYQTTNEYAINKDLKTKVFVLVFIPGSASAYLAPMKTVKDAIAYINTYNAKKHIYNNDLLIDYVTDSDWNEPKDDKFSPHIVTQADAEIGDVEPSTSYAMSYFNEEFSDLKNLFRRYQLYAQFKIDLLEKQNLCSVIAILPICPGGLPLNLEDPDFGWIANASREGLIPYLSSCFKFFRGSLRFKIIMHSTQPITLKLTHIPDVSELPNGVTNAGAFLRYDYQMSGYATFCQSTNVNQIFEIEIPYYKNCDKILVQRKSKEEPLNYKEHLGALEIVNLSKVQQNETCCLQVFYSLGDDAYFEGMMGYPSSVSKLDLPSHKFQRLDLLKYDIDQDSDLRTSFEDLTIAEAQMFTTIKNVKRCSAKMDDVLDKADNLIDNINTSVNMFPVAIERTKEECFALLNDIAEKVGLGLCERAIDVISQFTHLAINPNGKTVAVVLATLAVKAGIISVSQFSQMKEVGEKTWSKVLVRVPLSKQPTEVEIVEAQFLDVDECVPLVSTILSLIAVSLGVKKNISESRIDHFTTLFSKLILEVPRSSNVIVSFIKNNMLFFSKAFEYFTGVKNKEFACLNDLVNHHEYLREWAELCEKLLDPLQRAEIKRDMTLVKQTFACNIVARSLFGKLQLNGIMDSRTMYIRSVCERMNKLCDELVNDCLSPASKYEPFVIYIHGDPGCGKSFILEEVGISLLQSIGYTAQCAPSYVRQPTTAYWNGVTNQPILIYDDFGCTVDALKIQLEELFSIKSTTIFNPNIAELENKKRVYNPRIVMIASNQAFPQSNAIYDKDAVYRRRDVLIKCTLSEELKKMGFSRVSELFEAKARGELPLDVEKHLKDKKHLQFKFYHDVVIEDEGNVGASLSYEQFLNELKRRYIAYDTLEKKRFLNRVQRVESLFPVEDTAIDCEMLMELIENDPMFSNINKTPKELFKSYATAQLGDFNMENFIRELELKCSLNKTNEALVKIKFESEILGKDGHLTPIKCEEFEALDNYDCPHSKLCPDYVAYYKIGKNFFLAPVIAELDDVKDDDLEKHELFKRKAILCKPCGAENCALKDFRAFWLYVKMIIKPQILGLYVGTNVIKTDSHFEAIFRILNLNIGVIENKQVLCLKPSDKVLNRWNKIKCKFVEYLPFIKKLMKFVVGAAALIGVGFGAWALLRKRTDNEIEANIGSSGDIGVGKIKNKMKNAGKIKSMAKLKYSGNAEMEDIDLVSIISRNSGKIFVSDDKRSRGQNFLALCDRIIIVSKHFLESCRFTKTKEVILVYGKATARVVLPFESLKSIEIKESSLSIVKIDSNLLPKFRDIRRHIMTEDDSEYIRSKGLVVEYSDGLCVTKETCVDVVGGLRIGGSEDFKQQDLGACFKYEHARKGMCGAVLIMDFNRPKICGLHVAGTTYEGFSQPIFYEQFDMLEEAFEMLECVEPEFEEIEIPNVLKNSGIIFEGEICSEKTVRMPTESKLEESPLARFYSKSQYEPSILSKSDPRWNYTDTTPMFEAIKKKGQSEWRFISEDIRIRIKEDLTQKFLVFEPFLVDHKPTLSWKEVVEGIPGIYKSMQMGTSEGYPLVLKRPATAKGKRWLFDLDENHKFIKFHPVLYDELMEKRKIRLEGKVPDLIFLDSLKDCKLPKEKVRQKGKTRLFSCCPVEFQITWKQYFGLFQISMHQHRFKNETAIGIACDSMEWTSFVRAISSESGQYVTGDYSAFGDRLHPEILRDVLDIPIMWYKKFFPKDNFGHQMRKILVEELLNKCCLAGRFIYRSVGGIPSGFPMTVEINSLVNSAYLRLAFLDIYPGKTLRDFNRNIKLITYGDDMVCGVEKVVDEFNFINIKRSLEKYNIKFDSAQKDGRDYKFLDLCDVTFLKRSIVACEKDPNIFLGKLPFEVCEEIIKWKWKDNDDERAVFESARAYLISLFGHGSKIYEKERAKLKQNIFSLYRKHLDCETWNELFSKFMLGEKLSEEAVDNFIWA